MNCAECKTHNCYIAGQNCTRISRDELHELYTADDLKLMTIAADIEGNYYCQKTRLEESRLFAEQYGAKTIGLAFCIGLTEEAAHITKYFKQAFTVHSVCCKVCGNAKTDFALTQINPDKRETMCNPKIQAKILNDTKTDLNFTIGLCVGHDMIFSKEAAAPTSCLVAKDRVLAHNPLAAVYSRYWRNKLGI